MWLEKNETVVGIALTSRIEAGRDMPSKCFSSFLDDERTNANSNIRPPTIPMNRIKANHIIDEDRISWHTITMIIDRSMANILMGDLDCETIRQMHASVTARIVIANINL